MLREKRRLSFEELFESDKSRAELIVTFLALLEMTRLRMTRLFQDAPLDPIWVELSVSEEDEDESAPGLEPEAPVIGRAEPEPEVPAADDE